MRKCSLENINVVFAEIAKCAKLYVPTQIGDGSAQFKALDQVVSFDHSLN